MTSKSANIITDYRERCAQHLQGAPADSAEHLAYSRILRAFDQNQTGGPADRSFRIAQALAFEANSIEALPLAPPEVHTQMVRAREIITQWAEDFKRDAGHTSVSFTFRRR